MKATKTKSVTKAIKAKKPQRMHQKDPTRTKGILEGQKGPRMELPMDRLNEKELAVLKVFNCEGPVRGWYSIKTLAQWAFPVLTVKNAIKANSWVRNSLRRLVRGGWAEQPDKKKGFFRLTAKAHTRLSKQIEAGEKLSATA